MTQSLIISFSYTLNYLHTFSLFFFFFFLNTLTQNYIYCCFTSFFSWKSFNFLFSIVIVSHETIENKNNKNFHSNQHELFYNFPFLFLYYMFFIVQQLSDDEDFELLISIQTHTLSLTLPH